jgi:SAM-dependent methyltransferase
MSTRISPFSLKNRFHHKVVNTFFQAQWLWKIFFSKKKYQKVKSTRTGLIQKIFLKVFWFWPRIYEVESWRDAGIGCYRDPSNYISLDDKALLLLKEVEVSVASKNASILDLGCNAGRFLNELHRKGYTNLHGVDISAAAQALMKTTFPDLYKVVDFHCQTFQEYLLEAENRSMDIVFTHGATVELVHPSFPLIHHLCRICNQSVVLMIYESGHSYPRFWEWEFNQQGFILSKALRPAATGEVHSLLRFTRVQDSVPR